MRTLILAVIAAALAPTGRAQEVTLLLGGSPEVPSKLKPARFFPDFRESRTLIMESKFVCDMASDCEKDRTITYRSGYGGVPFTYFPGRVNMNFREQRLNANVQFSYVMVPAEAFEVSILGLSRDSDFLAQYFQTADQRSQLLRLSFRGEEDGRLSVANPYVRSQVKPFDAYQDSRNQENFFLNVTLRVAEADRPENVLLADDLRLCPFSNPARTNWRHVFFSGSKRSIDAYRQFFRDKVGHLDDYAVTLVHRGTGFVLKLNDAFVDASLPQLFKLGFADADACDLYFGFEFVQFFRMDFLIGFDHKAGKATLGFQTVSEPPRPFGYGVVGLGVLLVVIFCTFVFRTHYLAAPARLEKERSDLEESLRNV